MEHVSRWSYFNYSYTMSKNNDSSEDFWYAANATHTDDDTTFDKSSSAILIAGMLLAIATLPLVCAIIQRYCGPAHSNSNTQANPASDGNTVAIDEDDWKDAEIGSIVAGEDISQRSVPCSERDLQQDTSKRDRDRDSTS